MIKDLNYYKRARLIREVILCVSEIGMSFIGAMIAVKSSSDLAWWFGGFSVIFGIASVIELCFITEKINEF